MESECFKALSVTHQEAHMKSRRAAACASVTCVLSLAVSQAIPQRIRVSESVARSLIVKKIDPVAVKQWKYEPPA